MPNDERNLSEADGPDRLPIPGPSRSPGRPQIVSPLPLGCGFWVTVGLGTVAAGGMFGLMVACFQGDVLASIPGLVFGVYLAGFFAIPIHSLVATITWLLGLYRYRVALGGFAGGLTGIIATVVTFLPPTGPPPPWGVVCLAGFTGALGGTLAALWHGSLRRSEWEAFDANKQHQQFTIRRLLGAIAVAALLLGAVRYALDRQEKSRRESLTYKFKEVGHALHEFCGIAGSLPYPVRHAGGGAEPMPKPHLPDAKPLYSWRFSAVAIQSGAQGSVDKPWDDPANQHLRTWRPVFCLDDASRQPGHTNVLAITGPGTAFGDGRSEAPRRLADLDGDTILAVEVRRSGIHWMEPGDLDIRTMPQEIGGSDGCISGCYSPGFHVLFADGDVWLLSHDVPFAELRKFFTVQGAKDFDRDEVLRPYLVASP